MARICTVCLHRKRMEIDKLLIAAITPYREIAEHYKISPQSLLRHKADHVTADILAAWQRERADNGAELAGELRGWMDHITRLLAACHDFLADPDDPARYTLAPHTWEVVIHTEEWEDGDRRPTKRKLRLSEALARVDGKPGVGDVALVETSIADPRDLMLKAAKTLEGNQRLLAELVGKLATQGTVNFIASPEWVALRGRMLGALALHPEARLALAAALDGDQAREGEWREAAD